MICEVCKSKKATEAHHKFSDTKLNRKLYGKLLEDPRNKQMLCYGCHHNKPLDKWTERQFTEALGILPRSKTGIEMYFRMEDKCRHY